MSLQLYILHPEERTLVITASALIKAVTNVLPLTKTLDAFDVEERNAEYLENQCPNVTALLSEMLWKGSMQKNRYEGKGYNSVVDCTEFFLPGLFSFVTIKQRPCLKISV